MLSDKRQKKKKQKKESSRDHMYNIFSWIGEGTVVLHYKLKVDGMFEDIAIYRRKPIGRDERAM
jgi:hypothetical protein